MRGRQGAEHQRLAWRVDAECVTHGRHHVRLVERDPHPDPVGQPPGGQRRVVGEPLGGIPAQPAARVLQRLRQVPVVQRGDRRDPGGQQRVGQPLVEVEPGRVSRARAAGLDPRPADREPVGGDAEVGHQRDVLRPPVIVIGGHVAGVAVPDHPGLTAERIPDRVAAAVLGDGPFDLVGGSGHAPAEAGGEGGHRRVSHPPIVTACPEAANTAPSLPLCPGSNVRYLCSTWSAAGTAPMIIESPRNSGVSLTWRSIEAADMV